LKFPLTTSLSPGRAGGQAQWGEGKEEGAKIVRDKFSAYKSFKARQGFICVRI